MEIQANRMDLGFLKHQSEYEEAALRVLRSGWYILGKEDEAFEKEFGEYHGCYCAGLASGLDALWIGIKMLGIGEGDEVIVQGNTYIASVMGISINGATPVFTEPDEYAQIDVEKIEEKITPRTKALMVVHLYGHVCDMTRVQEICKKHHLYLIEDCAQAHGATWRGQKVGTFGDIGCFSFYPTKNIGAFGDAGAVISHSKEIIDQAKVYRNYGSRKHYYNEVVGANSRLDEMQAALLRVRMKYIDEITAERKALAAAYEKGLHNPKVRMITQRPESSSVWHQVVILVEERDRMIEYLAERGIKTIIHYPIPPHLSEAYAYLNVAKGSLPITEKYANSVISIPLYCGMTKQEQDYVIDAINSFA
ncbi:MAG: DegT/DnrJ/EryC1/StrS family aminotransferase [Lachnospiraceae bacterium]|nr:DegT/DnrJ/EryC1/StrS family aminotransferase [Lachnospiraceae bacterium]